MASAPSDDWMQHMKLASQFVQSTVNEHFCEESSSFIFMLCVSSGLTTCFAWVV